MVSLPRLTFASLAGVCLFLTAACNRTPPLPKTHPASGTVTYQSGQPMKGGSIQFTSVDDPSLRVIGNVESDGTFDLRTIKDNATATGAPEGDYKVIVQPPAVEDARGGVPQAHKGALPIQLPEKVKVEAKTNTFRIELPPAP